MALAKHASVSLRVTELLREAAGFARSAWRDCWLVMLFVIAGYVLTFLDKYVAAAEWSPGGWAAFVPLLFLFYLPLFGGLYRSAIGGKLRDTLGPGGLQWTGTEWRLIAVGIVIFFLIGVMLTPFLAATAVAALVMGLKATIAMGPLGQWARWAPAALVIWLAFFGLCGGAVARLMLGWPYSVARGKTEPFAGWGAANRSGWRILLAFVVVQVPLVLATNAPLVMTWGGTDAITPGYWPLPVALAVALVQGVLFAAIWAPLAVGVLAAAYLLLEEAGHAPVEGEVHEGPLDETMLAAAAALSAKEAAELDLPASEVDGQAHAEAGGLNGSDAHGGVEALEDNGAPALDDEGHAPPPAEAHTPDPALEGIHPAEPAPATDAAADEAMAAAHAHEAAEAAALAGHHAAAEPVDIPAEPPALPPEPPVEAHVEPNVEPPAAHVEPEPQPDGFHPLSPWPHSVLPPWPASVSFAAARARIGLPPLASAAEPAHSAQEGKDPAG